MTARWVATLDRQTEAAGAVADEGVGIVAALGADLFDGFTQFFCEGCAIVDDDGTAFAAVDDAGVGPGGARVVTEHAYLFGIGDKVPANTAMRGIEEAFFIVIDIVFCSGVAEHPA